MEFYSLSTLLEGSSAGIIIKLFIQFLLLPNGGLPLTSANSGAQGALGPLET